MHLLVRHTALLRRLSSHSAHSTHFPFSNRFLDVPINYFADEHGVYSTGVATYFLYAGVAVYTLVIFVETFRYKAALSEKKRFALRMQIVVWLLVFIAHIIDNYLLYSSVAISMSVVALYFSFENPNENVDENTGAFNARVFADVF